MENFREVRSVGYPVKARLLRVTETTMLSPRLKSVVLSGPDLEGFQSGSPDDHVKCFFPTDGGPPVVPRLGADGLQFPEDRAKPAMRDYTPVRFDPAKRELELIFFLHDRGPGTDWARTAGPGSELVVGGPRGSRIVPYNFDWYLMVGDETAIPSFTRRLRELPPDARAEVLIEVQNESTIIDLQHGPHVRLHWVRRRDARPGDPTRIQSAIKVLPFPPGDYFAWVIGESGAVKSTAELLRAQFGARKEWMKVTGYWDLDPDDAP